VFVPPTREEEDEAVIGVLVPPPVCAASASASAAVAPAEAPVETPVEAIVSGRASFVRDTVRSATPSLWENLMKMFSWLWASEAIAATEADSAIWVEATAPAVRKIPAPSNTTIYEKLGERLLSLGIDGRPFQVVLGASGGLLPEALRPEDQGRDERCVACSLSFAMWAAALRNTSSVSEARWLQDSRHMASSAHAYHIQRVFECESTGRCQCGPMCGGACDQKCGSKLSVMLRVGEAGFTTREQWPVNAPNAKAPDLAKECQPVFHLTDDIETLRAGDERAVEEVIRALRAGFPVILNMFVYRNQARFFAMQCDTTNEVVSGSSLKPLELFEEEELVSGLSGSIEIAETVYDPRHTMPTGDGARQRVGHCVVAVGCNADGTKVCIRNSLGVTWGCKGHFAVHTADIHPDQIHGIVIIRGARVNRAGERQP
jgi:hypothetical protein